ncbi:MAG TPA: winged helix-turn-helix domain-containing protein [Pyrinomonadaceae bacterium]|nr:winged helix-turn-helix domain-containing protein [Pyrinomonadaceae bacterium]
MLEFDSFRVDFLKRQLLCGEKPIPLTARAFDTLAMLLANRGTTVCKSELMNSVWGDTAVEENNLTQQIATLRRAFGERAGDHKFIVTVPGRGYCFVAKVTEANGLQFAPSDAPSNRRSGFGATRYGQSFLGVGLAIAYIVLVCVPVFLVDIVAKGSPTKSQSMAILTFRSAGEDVPIGDGIRDTLRAKLGSLDDITVRTGGPDQASHDVLDTGRRLQVDLVLAGSIQRDEGHIRVAVEMVSVSRERIVWGKVFDAASESIFELQDLIAKDVLEALTHSQLKSHREDPLLRLVERESFILARMHRRETYYFSV